MDDADAASDQDKDYQRYNDCQNYEQRLHLFPLPNMIETNKIAATKKLSAVKLPNGKTRLVLEQDKHEEDARHGFASEHDERRGQPREEATEKKKGRGKSLFGFFGKLAFKAKLVVFAVAAVIAVSFFGFALPWIANNHETQYLATSDLKSVVDIDSLSTIDYTYYGIAEKHGKFLWQDRVDYRVKYEAHIRASYTLSDIRFGINEEDKVVTAYLPEVQIDDPQLDNSKFGYLPESATADMKDVIVLCREDAANDVDKEEIKEQAEASLRDTVKALTLPLLGDEYQLEFKPIAEYNGEADSNA